MTIKISKFPILMVFGLLLIILGILIYIKPKNNQLAEQSTLGINEVKVEKEHRRENHANQNVFAKYVINKFSKRYFNAGETSSQLNAELKTTSIGFELIGMTGTILVATKWLGSTSDGMVKFLSDTELEWFKAQSKPNKTPTFLILGDGWSVSKPNNIYILPANQIESINMSRSQLNAFKKEIIAANFFYEPKEKALR